MSIANPVYKWTASAIYHENIVFRDVDISEDGKKVVVSGQASSQAQYIVLWVLDAVTGSFLK